jgi:hypothetical protein
MIPMVSLHREHLTSAPWYAVLGAIAFVVLGVSSGSETPCGMDWQRANRDLGGDSWVAVIMLLIVITATTLGMLTGEWRDCRLRTNSPPHPADRRDRARAGDFYPGRLTVTCSNSKAVSNINLHR